MSNLESSTKKLAADPIGYVTGAVTGDPSAATGGIEGYTPTGFSSPGLSGSVTDGTFSLTRSPELQESMGGLQSALSQRALEFANLRKGLRRDAGDIIGGLKKAGIEGIQGKRRRAVGDLRENLQSRRIAGSSFAADAVSRAEAEFAKEEAQFGAEADVKQFEMEQEVLGKEMELLNQETQANIEGFQSSLTQLNLESGLAAQISTAMSGIAAENARAIGEIMAQYAAARANIVGTVAGGITTGVLAGK
jgi:hypothetical protein